MFTKHDHNDKEQLYTGLRFMLPEEREVAKRVHSVNFYVEMPTRTGATNPTYWREFNSYGDFHLIPTSMPFIAPPAINEMTVEVPGSEDGAVDMNEALTGAPLYKMREGTLEFMYENAYRYGHVSHSPEWSDTWHATNDPISVYRSESALSGDPDPTRDSPAGTVIGSGNRTYFSKGMFQLSALDLSYNPFYINQNLMKFIHGKRVYLMLMDYPYYVFQGRTYVETMTPGQAEAGKVNIKYKFRVYQRAIDTSGNKFAVVNGLPIFTPLGYNGTTYPEAAAVQFSVTNNKLL